MSDIPEPDGQYEEVYKSLSPHRCLDCATPTEWDAASDAVRRQSEGFMRRSISFSNGGPPAPAPAADEWEALARVIHADHCCPCDPNGCPEPDPVDYNAAESALRAGWIRPPALTVTTEQIEQAWQSGRIESARDAHSILAALGIQVTP